MRIFTIFIKDIIQVSRDKLSLLFLLVMPLVFTYFMGFALKSAITTPDQRLSLGWLNRDTGGQLSESLKNNLEASSAVRLVIMDVTAISEAERQVRSGKLSGALVLPENFSEKALLGEPVQLVLITEPLSTSGQNIQQALHTPLIRLLGASAISRLSVDSIEKEKPFASETDRTAEQHESFSKVLSFWQDAINAAPQVILQPATPIESPMGGNPYNQTSPGMLVQFALFGLVTSATIIEQERRLGVMQRLFSISVKPREVLAGHMLAIFSIIMVQGVLLMVFGQLILGVNYSQNTLAMLFMLTSFSIWVASMGLFIGVIAKTEDQVVLFSLIAMFLFTALGGAWFPLDGTGPVFNSIGHLTPGAWAMDGFQNIIVRQLGVNSVWQPVSILLLYACVFFALTIWRFTANKQR